MGRNRRGKPLCAVPPTADNPFDNDSNTTDISESFANLSVDQNSNPSNHPDDEGWGYYTVDELEDIMVKVLIKHYQNVLACLANLGYDKPLALRAVLSNGHCYCSTDAFSKILPNTVAFIKASPSPSDVAPFSNLSQLAVHSLNSMICLLQQIRRRISHHNAVWCLFVTHFDLARASVMDIPCPTSQLSRKQTKKGKARTSKPLTPPADPTTVTGICRPQTSSPRCPYPSSSQEPLLEHMMIPDKTIRSHEGMNIAKPNAANESLVARGDHKRERIFDRMYQFKELEVQLKEQHHLAGCKALQSVQKLRNDLAELMFLLAEYEVNHLVRNENLVQNDSAVIRLSEMGAVKRLSEKRGSSKEANSVVSTKVCNQMAKSENERLKQLSAREKQADKIGDTTVQEPGKITQMKQLLIQKETEIKLRHEMMDTEGAFSLGMKKHNTKDLADKSMRREKEAMENDAWQQRIEVAIRPHKDDNQKLEEEISRSKNSARSNTFSSAKLMFPRC